MALPEAARDTHAVHIGRMETGDVHPVTVVGVGPSQVGSRGANRHDEIRIDSRRARLTSGGWLDNAPDRKRKLGGGSLLTQGTAHCHGRVLGSSRSTADRILVNWLVQVRD